MLRLAPRQGGADQKNSRCSCRCPPKWDARRGSRWIREHRGGLLRLEVRLGDYVEKGRRIGTIGDPFGDDRVAVKATFGGTVIGLGRNPVVYQGDALVHVAG